MLDCLKYIGPVVLADEWRFAISWAKEEEEHISKKVLFIRIYWNPVLREFRLGRVYKCKQADSFTNRYHMTSVAVKLEGLEHSAQVLFCWWYKLQTACRVVSCW